MMTAYHDAFVPVLPNPPALAERIADDARLSALRDLDLLDTLPEEAFDRFTRLASRLLGVPVSLVSLVDANRQFFKSQVGLEDPWSSLRQTPLSHSFCQYVVASGSPLIVDDARNDPVLRDNLAIPDIGVVAYLGVPLITDNGHGLGSFCAIDGQPRHWTENDIATLTDVAASIMTEIALRQATREAEHARDEVDRQRQFIRSVVESAADGIVALDAGGRIVDWNPAAHQLLSWESHDLRGQSLLALFAPASECNELKSLLNATVPWPGNDPTVRRALTIDSTGTMVELALTRASGSTGTVTAVLRDQTLQRRAEQVERDAHLTTMIQHGADIIIVLTRDLLVRYVSPSIQSVLGFTPTECREAEVTNWILDADRPLVVGSLESLDGRHDAVVRFDTQVRDRSGEYRWLEVIARNQVTGDATDGIVVNARDVTDRRQLEQQLQHDATHDVLTGLPNRSVFQERLDRARWQAEVVGMDVLVLFLDLDDFKVVNDSLGHGAGDRLLVEVGHRLSTRLGAGITVSRFGGDEFLVLVEHIADRATADRVVRRVMAVLDEPFDVGRHRTIVRASVGMVQCSLVAGDATEVLSAADTALYRAKAAGGGAVEIYAPWMADEARTRLTMEVQLREAVASDELVLHYQPIIDLATGALAGVEALLRWNHPERGVIGPDSFLPLAETTGLMHAIGRWVLEEACRQVATWAPDPAFQVWINIAVHQLRRPHFAEELRTLLAETGVSPHQVRLEITERITSEDGEAALETLHGLRALGVSLAIDDFGTGQSSLAALRRYPIDTLKIDRSLVAGIVDDTDARSVVEAIIGVGRALGLRVTAEGIETEAQRQTVRQLGCDTAQGYLFAMPLSPSALMERYGGRVETQGEAKVSKPGR